MGQQKVFYVIKVEFLKSLFYTLYVNNLSERKNLK